MTPTARIEAPFPISYKMVAYTVTMDWVPFGALVSLDHAAWFLVCMIGITRHVLIVA